MANHTLFQTALPIIEAAMEELDIVDEDDDEA